MSTFINVTSRNVETKIEEHGVDERGRRLGVKFTTFEESYTERTEDDGRGPLLQPGRELGRTYFGFHFRRTRDGHGFQKSSTRLFETAEERDEALATFVARAAGKVVR